MIRTEFKGICLNAMHGEELTTVMKMYSLLYADDTLLLSGTVDYTQRALDAAMKYCIQKKMTINVSKTKYMICSRGKLENSHIFLLTELLLSVSIHFATSKTC